MTENVDLSKLERVLASLAEASPAARREGLAPYATRAGIGRLMSMATAGGKNARAAARALCDLSSSKASGELISHYMDLQREKTAGMLKNSDPKVRKSAAQLLGNLKPDEFCSELIEALNTEGTEFVRPSIILAIGNAKRTPAAMTALTDYVLPSDCSEKHIREQAAALSKAISSLRGGEDTDVKVKALPEKNEILLRCPSAKVTAEELKALGYSVSLHKALNGFVSVKNVPKLSSLYVARSFYDMNVLYGVFDTMNAAVRAAKSGGFEDLIRTMYGEGELRFRVDVQSLNSQTTQQLRSKVSSEIAAELLPRGLINSPSNYAFSVRLLLTREKAYLGAAPAPKLDGRFQYRTDAISASIHPAVAASCMRFIKPYLKEKADVLDPFCGAGTMLFERAKYSYASLTGTDINSDALRAARQNERNAKTGAHFLIKNAGSPFRDKFDEVICNMPFGLRVGSHDENRSLYAAFLRNLTKMLKKDGVAFLFTHEKKLLAELQPESMELEDKCTFSAGGLHPSMFVLKNK